MLNHIFFAGIGILFMLFVLNNVKKNKLSEKESLFWMIGSFLIVILGMTPTLMKKIANILGIQYAPSLLFLVGIIFILGLTFRITIYISQLKEQTKELAERNGILEKRISDIEKMINRYK